MAACGLYSSALQQVGFSDWRVVLQSVNSNTIKHVHFSRSVCITCIHGYFIKLAEISIVSSFYLALVHALIVFIKFIAPCYSLSLYVVCSLRPAGVQFNELFLVRMI